MYPLEPYSTAKNAENFHEWLTVVESAEADDSSKEVPRQGNLDSAGGVTPVDDERVHFGLKVEAHSHLRA